ncbi:hypothetical protein FE633_40455 [Streptomyces montanus]|uniref:Uncharacterized protein n=1 Tax=Streptomyces montanus TaxID=2580423 RepID=A0A5R9FM31_9ACTN|nr:hypothetical protein [Streptomyces montanus]TLS40615.1 hypothetical protein FE633_40455 [Streptomyces montanus]
MADDRPDANTPGQGGNHGDGAQLAASPPPDPPTPDGGQGGDAGGGWFSRHQQAAWIGAGATVLAALITVAVPILGSSGDDKADGASTIVPTSSAPTSAPESIPSSASPSKQTETPDPDHGSSPRGSEIWRGSLVLDTEPKDLDAGQPVAVGYADEGDLYMTPENQINGGKDTVISLWSGSTTSPPGYEECSKTVTAEGTNEQQLTKDVVLCIRTGAGNIVRLKLTELGSNGLGSDYRNKFDAVIWDAG